MDFCSIHLNMPEFMTILNVDKCLPCVESVVCFCIYTDDLNLQVIAVFNIALYVQTDIRWHMFYD